MSNRSDHTQAEHDMCALRWGDPERLSPKNGRDSRTIESHKKKMGPNPSCHQTCSRIEWNRFLFFCSQPSWDTHQGLERRSNPGLDHAAAVQSTGQTTVVSYQFLHPQRSKHSQTITSLEHLYKISCAYFPSISPHCWRKYIRWLPGAWHQKNITMIIERIGIQACLVRLQTTLHQMAWVANAILGDAKPANASQPSQTRQ